MEEEIMAEDEETIDGIHPQTLTQNSPSIVINAFSFFFGIFSSYGWILLFGVFLIYYLRKKYQPKYEEWRVAAEHHKNPDKFLARENAIAAARQKMQDKYDQEAKKRAQKSQSEESPPESVQQPAPDRSKTMDKTKEKLRLRPAYNPLMGDTSSCAFRPGGGGRRSGGG